MTNRRKIWLFCTLASAVSVVVAFVVFELALRLIDFHHPSFWVPDPVFGSRLRAGTTGNYSVEGFSEVTINSVGFNDREWQRDKPKGILRIAVLGDSYTEALQVDVERNFSRVLERSLNQKLEDCKVEVMNFGVSGFGTAQEFLLYQNIIKQYSPDIVVLAFLTGNDVRNNCQSLEPSPRPFFVRNEDQLVLESSFVNDPAFVTKSSVAWQTVAFVSRYLRTVQLLNKVRQNVAKRKAAKMSQAGGDRLEGEAGLDMAVYKEPVTPEWKEAWKVTEMIIGMLAQEVEKSGAEFVLVSLSNAIQVNPDPSVREDFLTKHGITSLYYPDERIMNFCRQNGIRSLSLAKHLCGIAEESESCLHGFENAYPCSGHWNEEGHLAAGERIAKELEELVRIQSCSN